VLSLQLLRPKDALQAPHRDKKDALAPKLNNSPAAPSIPSFKVVLVPGKGLGAVATTRLARGNVVAEEAPLLQLGSGLPSAEQQMETLNAAQREQIWNLSDCSGPEKSLAGILDTNCFRTDSSDVRVLCPSLARFNHSCLPNCQQAWDGNEQTLRIIACVHIEEGDELCIDYIDLRQGWRQRQFELRNKYGFLCSCPACVESSEASDRRRIEMVKFDKEIGIAPPKRTLELVGALLQLYDDENLQLQGLRGRACLDACAACARLGDAEALKSWAKRAQRHYADALGPFHPLTQKAATYASKPKSHRQWS